MKGDALPGLAQINVLLFSPTLHRDESARVPEVLRLEEGWRLML